MLELLGALLLIALAIVAIPLLMMWNGYVLATMYNWFIPVTFGLGQISVVQAMGIALIVGLFKSHDFRKKDDAENKKLFAAGLLSPLVVLVVGYILKGYL